MTAHGMAHGLSLPLHFFIQKAEGRPADEASMLVTEEVVKLGLSNDILVVLVLHRGMSLSLEALSDFGKAVLEELKSRSEFTPCPEGECEFSGLACKWCGAIQGA